MKWKQLEPDLYESLCGNYQIKKVKYQQYVIACPSDSGLVWQDEDSFQAVRDAKDYVAKNLPYRS